MTGQTLSRLTLTALVLVAITGCRDEQKIKADQDALVRTSLDNLVTVKGGSFQMGNFSSLMTENAENRPYDFDNDAPLHPVTLSDFRIGKYRVTWGEFNRWLSIQGRDKTKYYRSITDLKSPDSQTDKISINNSYPAKSNWHDARNYCQWLGKISGRNMDLPTEAQWEYASRNRGQFIAYANSDNKWHDHSDKSRNFVDDFRTDNSFKKPVGSYPPTPLGLYDMMGNGADWIKDWYAADYYLHSPKKDPQGPKNGTKKVTRGENRNEDNSYTITRGSWDPDNEWLSGIRCVENSPLK